jgi:hypothetical protein
MIKSSLLSNRFLVFVSILFIVLSVFICGLLNAAIPQQVDYQGRLVSSNGTPLSGNYNFVFEIYDAVTVGSQLWTETQGAVPVTNGVFSVNLGSNTVIPTAVFDSPARWLQVSVNGETMLPRVKLVSVPYAYTAEHAYAVLGTTVTGTNIVDGAVTAPDLASDANSLSKVSNSIMTIFNGNIGIGTNTPSGIFQIEKDVNTGNAEALILRNDSDDWTVADKSISILFTRRDKGVHDFSQIRGGVRNTDGGKGYLSFWTGGGSAGSEKMCINWDGNIGVGLTNPVTKIDVTSMSAIRVGDAYVSCGSGPNTKVAIFSMNSWYDGAEWHIPESTSTSSAIRMLNGAIDFFQTQTPGGIDWVNRMSIAANGNIGIGTTNPTETLHLENLRVKAREFVISDNNSGWHGQHKWVRYSDSAIHHLFFMDSTATDQLNLYLNLSAASNSTLKITGNVQITGSLSKGSGSFLIDHPQDPANKVLRHSFVESPDMMNVYNGIVVLNANGEAVIELPGYFDSLNKDYKYQLTAVGRYAPVFIKEEIINNKFIVASQNGPIDSGIKVSWQVTGVRKDSYAVKNPIITEEIKGQDNDFKKGEYVNPGVYK